MMDTALVSTVIVSFNSGEVLLGALETALRCREAGLTEECIVIDNRSTDGTPARVRRRHPWCRLIESPQNLGFGRGANLGMACARAPYVLLLNPDAALEPAALAALIALLDERPRAGAVAPAIRQPDGRLQFAGGLATPFGFVREAMGKTSSAERRTIEPGSAPFRTDWLCGAVVLLRREMIDDIGGFDPRFFLYFEETDLWRRARNTGWELWATGEATATHVQAGSARNVNRSMVHGCIAEHYYRSRFLYLGKHFGWLAAFTVEMIDLLVVLARLGGRLLRRRDASDLRDRLAAPLVGRVLAR